MLHLNFADQHHHGDSRLHRLDPRVKLAAAFGFILAASLLPPDAWLAYGLLLAGLLVTARLTGLGTAYALRRSYVALPFALAAVSLPFTVRGQVVAQLGPLAVSAEGLVRFAGVLLKSWLSVQAALLLTGTTAFQDLLWALRALRLPPVLVSIIGFMYRYLFVLGDESLRLMRARAARSGVGPAGRSGGGLAWRGRVAGGMVGNLALRAFERSERIYDAMLARGFQGEMRVLTPPVLAEADRLALVVWATFLAGALLIGFVL